jgi:FAD/FMN-containing dehydrogenase
LNRDGQRYEQSHVAFAFLLDYVPNWRLAYGPSGFIQYQLFVPKDRAKACIRNVLSICQMHNMPSFLGVLKRHRADGFLLSHGLDGSSNAMDFAVEPSRAAQLRGLTRELTQRVLEAGGTFYFAKDAVLEASDVEHAYGRDRLDRFWEMKTKLDPKGLFESQLSRRLLVPLAD